MKPKSLYLDRIKQLQLQHLADSALPIGATAHSFGLETLVTEGILTVERLPSILRDYLSEGGRQEAAFCRAAHNLSCNTRTPTDISDQERWLELNRLLSARKAARESRDASVALGRRFLQLVCQLDTWPIIENAWETAKQAQVEVHYANAFGLTGGALELEATVVVSVYLHQSLAGLISACQRLLPLGQTQASKILWNLKPNIVKISAELDEAENPCEETPCFMPLLDISSMRHPFLDTRLFIS